MGRPSTGAVCTGQCTQLNLKYLTPQLRKSEGCKGSIEWSNGAKISIEVNPTPNGGTLHLSYVVTDRDGKKHPIDYTVWVISKPANIGRGRVFYFVCPFKGRLCRTLYIAYGSHYFKSREAYQHRIYYASQISSRLDKYNDAYWRLERRLPDLYKKHPKTHYQGKPTAARERLERLRAKQVYYDKMRWAILPKSVMKHLGSMGMTSVAEYF